MARGTRVVRVMGPCLKFSLGSGFRVLGLGSGCSPGILAPPVIIPNLGQGEHPKFWGLGVY